MIGICSPLAEHRDLPILNCLSFPQKASKYAVYVPSLTLFNGLGHFPRYNFFCVHTEMEWGRISTAAGAWKHCCLQQMTKAKLARRQTEDERDQQKETCSPLWRYVYIIGLHWQLRATGFFSYVS